MAPTPFGSRKAAKTVRNLAFAEAALALFKRRGRSSKRVSTKVLVIGGSAVAAAGAAAVLGRKRGAGLWPSGDDGSSPPEPLAPPQPSNYDAPGPPANTATPIPAPDPQGEPPARVDPAAEEAAAAAEAGAIGGEPSGYAGPIPGDPADEALRPLAEAGEGESEGQEQAEAELTLNATDTEPGPSDAERQIDDAIEQAGQPQSGETLEALATPVDETSPDVPGGGISGRPHAGLDETPGAPATGAPEPEEGAEPATTSTPGTPPTQDDDDDEGGEYRTWSGDAVKP
jgi:hypothetical protein